MDTLFERPRVVYNRDASELGHGIPLRYQPLGLGKSPREFESEIRQILARQDGRKHALVAGIANGSLPKALVTSFARDLSIYAHRIASLDGLVAWKAEWYGFDHVVRLAQPLALNWGYWTRQLPLAERLIALAKELGVAEGQLPLEEPSMALHVYLRVRETMNQGGAGVEVALASTFPEAQWQVMAPLIADGLVKHYGVSGETAAMLRELAALDGTREQDRIPFLLDVAFSMRQQQIVLRAMKEIFSVWDWTFENLASPRYAEPRAA